MNTKITTWIELNNAIELAKNGVTLFFIYYLRLPDCIQLIQTAGYSTMVLKQEGVG